jgi:hypothetical protein
MTIFLIREEINILIILGRFWTQSTGGFEHAECVA